MDGSVRQAPDERAKKGLRRHFSSRLRGARALHGVVRSPIAARRPLRTMSPVRLAQEPVVGDP